MTETKIIIILIIVIFGGLIIYDSVYNKSSNEDKLNYNDISNKFKLYDVYIDDTTCVEYLYHGYTDSYSITPRLDSDGKVKLNQECLER